METPSILPASWRVPQAFRGRLGAKVGRQRVMCADGHLLLVLHRPPRPNEDERTGRFLWRTPEGNWSSNDLGNGAQALNKHLAEYADLIEKYDRMEEQANEADDYYAVLRGISPLLRSTRNLYQVLQEARQECPDDRDIINCRDRAYELERSAELLHSGARHSLEYAVAKRAEEQTRFAHETSASAHRLNRLAAFFFPLATLAAIFGTNLPTGLERFEAPLPFAGVVLLGLALGFMLYVFVTSDSRERPRTLKDRYGP
jgi:hypothetical protein